MSRFSALPFEKRLPGSDDIEEVELGSVDPAPHSRAKLGIAWSCATLAGVLALAYSSFSQFSPPMTMLVLVAILVAYAGYGYSLTKKNPIPFADSLYYMGFLWALCALITTFVFWPVPKLTADAVLTTFGYALVTTFVGMLLRLVIVQFHDTLPDRLVHAQETIDRRVAALTREISDATMEISSFRDRVANDLDGTLRDLVQSLAGVREGIAEQQVSMSKMLSEGFESSLKDILSRVAAIQIPQEILTAEVTKLVDTLGKRGEEFDKAATRLEKSLMQTADTVSSFGDSLYGSDGAKQVGAAVNDLSLKVKERTKQFGEMTTVLERSRTELDGQLNSLQSLRSAVSMVSTELSTFQTELSDLSSTSMSVEVKNGLMNMQKAIQSSLEASKAIESTMRDVLFFMRARMTEEPSSERS